MLGGKYIIPVFLAGTIMFVIFLFFIVMYVLIYRRRRLESLVQLTRLDFEHKNQLLVARLEEQECAMAHISKEIHDNVAQQVDLLMMNLKATEEAESESERRSTLQNSRIILSHISNDLRNASYSLNGEYIKIHGLYEVLNKEVGYISDTRRISCALQTDDHYRSLPPATELLIFRIAQEALHNVIKHAQASELRVRLDYQPDRFTMSIADNGIGFQVQAQTDKRQSLGLQNMMQRAVLLDADLIVDSAPGHGCRIILDLKLDGTRQ